MTTPAEIIRCFKYDGWTDLEAAARHCDKLSTGFRLNPWADPADAGHYAEAARRLRAEASTNNPPHQTCGQPLQVEKEQPCQSGKR